jgi:hypothetical protein
MYMQIGANFCERPFLLNGETLLVHGCGGQLTITSTDGTYFAVCEDFSEKDKCGVHTFWHCV